MIDDNWDLITGNAAHEIEVLNYSNQVNVIEALVHLLMHLHTGPDGSCAANPNERVLKEFHRTATLFLLHAPGEFRDGEVVVRTSTGVIVHEPPKAADMQPHIDAFFDKLHTSWGTASPFELAARALWMINWIHPFKNGNGRTARAFCYACLSLKLGFILPGSPTVIDLIMQNRDEYQDALKAADVTFEATGEPDLTMMIAFVDRLLAEQFASLNA